MGLAISRKRFRFPIIVVALFVGVLLGLWVLSGDRFDVGSRRMYSIMAGIVSFALIIGWFWLASGAPWKQRLATFLLAVAVIGGLVGSIQVRQTAKGNATVEAGVGLSRPYAKYLELGFTTALAKRHVQFPFLRPSTEEVTPELSSIVAKIVKAAI